MAESVAPALSSLTPEDRAKALSVEHPEYTAHKESWQILLDAFEGDGGFLTGSYLWPYPRENGTSFRERQAMARYHNYFASLVGLYSRFLFTNGVKRTSKNQDYEAWTTDVDGTGKGMDDLLRDASAMALSLGHACVLVDKTQEEAVGPAKADEQARVVASVFPATTVQDWRFDRDTLVAVKLREAAPEPSIIEEIDDDASQFLLWSLGGWARYDADGHFLASDNLQLGLVPLVNLRPDPSHTSHLRGRSIIGNANIVRALFNRCSEEDEVLRSQAFSLLTVEVPTDGNPQNSKDDLGGEVGTSRAIVVRGKVDFKTPDQQVPATIRANIQYLVQELHRAAHVRYQRDSLDAESADAIRLQQTELNEMLQGYARSLAQAERQIARCWFAWSFPTPDAAQAAFEAAEIEVQYPTEFFLDQLINDLQAWGEAVRLGLGPTMEARIKKAAVRRLDANIPPEELTKIDSEIEALPTQAEQQQASLDALDTGDPVGQGIKAAMNG